MDSWNVLTDIEDDAEESSERRGEKRDWDTMLPYVLFAYWEVPQATLGFSPFELLYGRDIREPLDVLQEKWINNQAAKTDVLSYIMGVRDRMDKAKELVAENARNAQGKQKEYYDKKTREMDLKPGYKVLLLLLTSTRSLMLMAGTI
jgi:hypothetical protein